MNSNKTLLSISAIALSFAINAQVPNIGKRIENKTKQKVNERVDRKIDQTIDKSLDKIEDPNTYKNSDSTGTDTPTPSTETNTNSIFKSGDKSSVLKEYQFSQDVLMEMESFDKKGKSSGVNNMRMLFNNNGDYFGSEIIVNDDKGNTSSMGFSIFDWKNNQMISLIDNGGMKIGMVIDMKAAANSISDANTETDSAKETSFKKTGKTKTILGYLCEEYLAENEETLSEVWIANDVKINMGNAFQYISENQKSKKNKMSYPNDAPEGFMMEMVSTNKKNNEKTRMTVVELNENKNTTVNTSSYKFM
jgi:hypothetical protein